MVRACNGVDVTGTTQLVGRGSLQVASETVSRLGESPRWDAARGVLWWVDIDGRALNELRADGSTVRRPLEHHAGAVNLANDGRLLLATTVGLELFDPSTGATQLVVSIEAGEPERRMNDAAVDPTGGVFAGTMRWDAGDPPHDGVLYRIVGSAPAIPVLSQLGCPNGLSWPRPGLMAYIDSMTRSIGLWAVDSLSGQLLEQTAAIDTSQFDGVPDGMTSDEDGALWVGFWNGGTVRRFALDGEVLATIDVPTPLVTAVAFGGDNLATLYITTASGPSPDTDPFAGVLLSCTPGQRGVLPHRWSA